MTTSISCGNNVKAKSKYVEILPQWIKFLKAQVFTEMINVKLHVKQGTDSVET